VAQTILESSVRFASLGLPLSLAGLMGTAGIFQLIGHIAF
jgi:hypothetical protein